MLINKYNVFFSTLLVVLLSGCRPRLYHRHLSKFPDQSSRATCSVNFKDDRCERTQVEEVVKEQLSAPPEIKKKFSDLSLCDLQKVLNYTKSVDNKEISLKAIQHMIPLCNDQLNLERLRLESADLNFDLGKLEQAEKLYKEFVTLYPNSINAEYALYKELLCRYYGMLSCDRDQTITHETLTLAQRYLQVEVYKEYVTDVQSIEKQCYNRLFEHELSVFDFYLNKGNYRAAQARLETIKTTYSKVLSEQEQAILLAELELAKLQNNKDLVELKETELLQKFPQLKTSVASTKRPYVSYF